MGLRGDQHAGPRGQSVPGCLGERVGAHDEGGTASVDLAQFGLNRTNIGALECKFTTTVQNKVDTFMNYKFTNCQIGRYSIAADAQGMPVETLSFSFQTVNFTFTARDTKLVGMPKSVTYDLTSAKTS